MGGRGEDALLLGQERELDEEVHRGQVTREHPELGPEGGQTWLLCGRILSAGKEGLEESSSCVSLAWAREV